MISNTNYNMNFLKLNEAMRNYFNRKSLLIRVLEQLVFDSVFILPICFIFSDTIIETVIYYFVSILFLYFVYPYLKSVFFIFRMKIMRKDALVFYIKILEENKFPKYGETQSNGSKWLDKVVKDSSIACEKRVAAAELALIVYNIMGRNGGGMAVEMFENNLLAEAINNYEKN